jgi:hypothetical protein
MITASNSGGGRRVTMLGSTLLAVVTVCSGTACASVGWSRSVAHQSATDGRTDVIPGSWERVDRLPAGTRVAVTLKTGARIEGRFKARRPDAVVLTDADGNERSVPTSDVFRVTAPARDSLTSGALIGAGIGLGTAIAVLAIAGSGEGYLLPSAKWGAPLLLSSVGSLAGMVVDRMHTREELIYTAPLRATP